MTIYDLHFLFWVTEMDLTYPIEKYKNSQCQTRVQFKKFNFVFISYPTDSISNKGKCLSPISIFTTALSFHLQLRFVLHVINQKNKDLKNYCSKCFPDKILQCFPLFLSLKKIKNVKYARFVSFLIQIM